MNPSTPRVLVLLACHGGLIALVVALICSDVTKWLGFASGQVAPRSPRTDDPGVRAGGPIRTLATSATMHGEGRGRRRGE